MYNDSNVIWEVRPALVRRLIITGGVLAVTSLGFYIKDKRSLALLTFIAFLLFSTITITGMRTLYIWNSVLMRNGDVVEQPVNMENLPRRLVNEGIRYLEKQSASQPFLLMMSWVQVHTALHASWKFQGKICFQMYRAWPNG